MYETVKEILSFLILQEAEIPNKNEKFWSRKTKQRFVADVDAPIVKSILFFFQPKVSRSSALDNPACRTSMIDSAFK